MQISDFLFIDPTRNRDIPVCVYLPETVPDSLQIVIFNPGYQSQEDLLDAATKPGYKNYQYLAEFFTARHRAFISIQHDLLGDTDGLETIDPAVSQHEAREHLYIRGVANIRYVINQLQQCFPFLSLEKLIIAGHSNGGDIAKYFANQAQEQISEVITFDARRCRIQPTKPLRVLMFEANDTSTDLGVIPEGNTQYNAMRSYLEWIIVKPKNALHVSYNGSYLTDELKHHVYNTMEWFLA